MNAFTGYLEKLGSNFLVSSMVPSLALVVASVLMFDPILHVVSTFNDPKGSGQLVGFGLIVFVVTVLIGYILTVLNTHILKVFEGYIIPLPFRFISNKARRIYQQKAQDLLEERENIKQEYKRLKRLPSQHPQTLERLEKLRDDYYLVASKYDEEYPADPNDVLPTRFGNLLRAAEDHAGQRYGFDGVTFWSRLIHVIPDSYKATIDSARNEVSFLANMSILSAFFASFCILAVFHVMLNTDAIGGKVFFDAFLGATWKYWAAAIAGLCFFFWFYKASIISLGSFTLTIRSSFDLFRLDLLRKLEVQRPKNSDEEFDTWKNINELIVLGNNSLTFKPFKFRQEK